MQSFTEELSKVMGIINYRGCLITPKNDGFYTFNGMVRHDSMEEAKKAIDRALNVLHKITIIK